MRYDLLAATASSAYDVFGWMAIGMKYGPLSGAECTPTHTLFVPNEP